jgi:hypothetical protein
MHEDPGNREALWLLANVAHDRAVTAYAERSSEQVLLYSPKPVERFARLAQLGNMTRREINAATYIYGDLAEVHIALHRFADAVRYARLGIEFSRDIASIPGPRGQAFNMLAGALMYMGDYQGALEAVQEARKQLEQLRHEDPNPSYIRLIQYQTRCREALKSGRGWQRQLGPAARSRGSAPASARHSRTVRSERCKQLRSPFHDSHRRPSPG